MNALLSRRDLLRAMAAASLVAACGAVAEPGGRPGTGASLIKSAVARAAPDPKAAASAAAAIEALSADLHRELGAKSGNLFYSPYSVQIALAMARVGAVGATKAEMDRVLHVSTAADLDVALNALDQELA